MFILFVGSRNEVHIITELLRVITDIFNTSRAYDLALKEKKRRNNSIFQCEISANKIFIKRRVNYRRNGGASKLL